MPLTTPSRRALAGLAGALVALTGCNEDAAGPGGRQANAIWARDFAPAPRVYVVAGGPGAIAVATGTSLRVLDNAIGDTLFTAPWSDTLSGGTITSSLVVAPTRRGAVAFARPGGARIVNDTLDPASAGGTVATAIAVASAGNVLVLLRADGQLRGLELPGGRERWRIAGQCGASPCGSPRLVALAGGFVAASGRRVDGSGSFITVVDAATGATRPTGFAPIVPWAASIAAVDTVDLAVMDQTNDSLFLMRSITGNRIWGRGLRVQSQNPPASLVGSPSPISLDGAVLTSLRSGDSPAGVAFERANGNVRWERAAFIPFAACGTRYLARDADGWRLYDARTGQVYLRVAPFRAADTTLIPRVPVVAGDIVVSYTSRTAVRAYAC